MKAADIIRRIQVTEKGTAAVALNKYLFEVAPDASKIEIRNAVEKQFNVKVRKINTMNYLGKRRRERIWRYGRRSNWKRAVVTLCEGQKIEIT